MYLKIVSKTVKYTCFRPKEFKLANKQKKNCKANNIKKLAQHSVPTFSTSAQFSDTRWSNTVLLLLKLPIIIGSGVPSENHT